ncbi:hypothetical protein MPH_07624 [Macrophomina phaseolina MS6]|uniref:Uncharacterized protein n=1 Tax=Macrophomina phaseolina (strain MS6) TaxID=1126212 RepID=K2RQY6_MACPH|nr:hypothetical protein MPH_07624 [Macrophomina phaseolina MS6]
MAIVGEPIVVRAGVFEKGEDSRPSGALEGGVDEEKVELRAQFGADTAGLSMKDSSRRSGAVKTNDEGTRSHDDGSDNVELVRMCTTRECSSSKTAVRRRSVLSPGLLGFGIHRCTLGLGRMWPRVLSISLCFGFRSSLATLGFADSSHAKLRIDTPQWQRHKLLPKPTQ